jgi:hypothetical protein
VGVFLSHNHADKDFVRLIGLRMQRLGVNVWLDEAEINPGDSLIEKISQGIESCEYVVAFISKNSIDSPWVKKELSIALTREIKGKLYKVIPVLLDYVDIPVWLEDKLYVDFIDKKDITNGFGKLLKALRVNAYFDVSPDNLELLDYSAAIVLDDRILALASSVSFEDDYIYRDPDGITFPLKDMHLIEVNNGLFKSRKFTSIRIGHSCVVESQKHYIVYANTKPRQGTYEMCGFKWLIRKDELTVQRVETVFENKNWGWYPVIEGDLSVSHFSFDGYFRYNEQKNLGRVEPVTMEKEHVRFIGETSRRTIPNSAEHIAGIIRKYM